MSDVFISYSRKDKSFVQKLHDALRSQNQETWVDWDSIQKTEEWWSAIERGIEGANTFVFVISPDSVASEICRDEIDHAVKHNKRLVPLVCRDVENAAQVHPALGKLNWLFLREQDPFETTFAELITAIETDLEHVRSHTRILQRGIEWEREGRNPSFVLRGDDLQRAQTWLTAAEQEEPKPTELQREYISASHASEEAATILLQAGQRAKRLVQIGSGVLALTLVGSAIAAGLAWRTTEEAKAGTRIERVGALALRRFDTDQADGLRLAMQAGFELRKWTAGKSLDQYPAISPFLVLQSGLEKIRETKIPSNQGIVRSVAFSPDGTRIATGGNDGSIKLWDKDGKPITTINSNQDIVWSVAFSSDGTRIAAGGNDGSTKLGDKDGKLITTINSNQGSVLSVAFSPDGARIATGGDAGSIKLWDKDGKLITTINGNQSSVRSIAFSPNGARIATGGDAGSIKLWDKDGKLITTINGNQGIVRSVAFSPDGTRIATGGDAGSVKLWDKDGKLITTINSNQGGVESVSFSPDGTRIAIIGNDGSTTLWDKDGKLITTINSNQSGVRSMALSPDGTRIAIVGNDGSTALWDKDGKLITTINSNQGSVRSVAFSPDGTRIATVGNAGNTKLWDKDGKLITIINSNQGRVWSVSFSPDGTRIATVGNDSSTILWDKDGKLITTINSNQGSVRSVAFSPDGMRIATIGNDDSTALWDKDGNQVGQFEGGSSVFSPDWQTIAIVQNPSYFGAPLPDSQPSIVNLYRVDLNLDSLLRRACQRLKPYILDDPKQRTEQSQCEQHLGENWEAERTAK